MRRPTDIARRLRRSLGRPAVAPPLAAAPVDRQTVTLRERRDELGARVAELQYDLGGLTYEMAARDHFRLDVLTRRAAALQKLDAELGEVERLLRMEESGTAGSCRSCGAVRSRTASFCWSCGRDLAEHGGTAALAPASGEARDRAG